MRYNTRHLTLLLFAWALMLSPASEGLSQNLEIHCLDVWQGDCTLIISPTGRTMLIDAGEHDYARDIDRYLDSLGVSSFNYIVATHYHGDHIGSIYNLLNWYGYQVLDSVYDRGWEYCTTGYEDYYEPSVRGFRATIEDGQIIDLGGGVVVRCCGVNGKGKLVEPFIDRECDNGGVYDENDFCVALVVSYNNFDFFVAGDLGGYDAGGYQNIEDTVGVAAGDVEVYQVDHHGSMYSSNRDFLGMIDPEVSVISVGEGNPYGHPHSGALQRLGETSVIYRTDQHGNVVIKTDGTSSYKVRGHSFEMPVDSLHVFLMPHSYPMKILLPGETIVYNELVINNAEYAKQVEVWTELRQPDGGVVSPVDSFSVELLAGEMRELDDLEHSVDPGPPGRYEFVAKIGDHYAEAADSFSFFFEFYATGIEENIFTESVPSKRELALRSYPNPFNSSTEICYSLSSAERVTVEIYDLLGRQVWRLSRGHQSAGDHRLLWDGRNERGETVGTGVYYLFLRAGVKTASRKLVILR
jgi:competence protein ComEC